MFLILYIFKPNCFLSPRLWSWCSPRLADWRVLIWIGYFSRARFLWEALTFSKWKSMNLCFLKNLWPTVDKAWSFEIISHKGWDYPSWIFFSIIRGLCVTSSAWVTDWAWHWHSLYMSDKSRVVPVKWERAVWIHNGVVMLSILLTPQMCKSLWRQHMRGCFLTLCFEGRRCEKGVWGGSWSKELSWEPVSETSRRLAALSLERMQQNSQACWRSPLPLLSLSDTLSCMTLEHTTSAAVDP